MNNLKKFIISFVFLTLFFPTIIFSSCPSGTGYEGVSSFAGMGNSLTGIYHCPKNSTILQNQEVILSTIFDNHFSQNFPVTTVTANYAQLHHYNVNTTTLNPEATYEAYQKFLPNFSFGIYFLYEKSLNNTFSHAYIINDITQNGTSIINHPNIDSLMTGTNELVLESFYMWESKIPDSDLVDTNLSDAKITLQFSNQKVTIIGTGESPGGSMEFATTDINALIKLSYTNTNGPQEVVWEGKFVGDFLTNTYSGDITLVGETSTWGKLTKCNNKLSIFNNTTNSYIVNECSL